MSIIQLGFTKDEIETLRAAFYDMPSEQFMSMCNSGLTKEEWIDKRNLLKKQPNFKVAKPSGETIEYDASSIINKIDSSLN